jgi:hypoxanthine phosphoribosyltransferase
MLGLNSKGGATTAGSSDIRVVINAEQVQKRVREMARQISHDYLGRTIYAVCILENGFMFMADLVRALEVPVVCQFVKPERRESATGKVEIFFSPEVQVEGGHVLLVEAVVQSGVTSEFLMRNLMARGAASVKLATLLDKQAARRISLQPDYFGFLVENTFLHGYGLGSPDLGRNLPFIAATIEKGAGAKS